MCTLYLNFYLSQVFSNGLLAKPTILESFAIVTSHFQNDSHSNGRIAGK